MGRRTVDIEFDKLTMKTSWVEEWWKPNSILLL